MTATSDTVNRTTLDQAAADHRAGRLAAAEHGYRLVLAAEPGNVDALHLSGVLAAQRGDGDRARRLIEQAIAACGDVADFHANLALVLLQQGQPGAAAHRARLAKALDPEQATAARVLAAAVIPAASRGQLEALTAEAGRHLAEGDPRAAVDSFRRAAILAPDSPPILTSLGVALQQSGRLGEAVAAHRAALDIEPGFGAAWFNLGLAYEVAACPEQAVDAYARCRGLDPNLAGAASNQAGVLAALGRFAEAAAAARAALAAGLTPAAPAWLALGNALRETGDYSGAEAAYRRAVAERPGLGEAWANCGVVLREQGRSADAAAALERALACGLPDPGGTLGHLAHLNRMLCRWQDRDRHTQALVALVADGRSARVHPFAFLGEIDDGGLQRRCAVRYAEARFGPLRRHRLPPSGRVSTADRDRPLRLGYLSADFRDHATALLIAELIERHDRGRFSVYGYSYGVDDGGPLRHRLSQAFDRFVEVRDLGFGQAAAAIRRDRIDILIDLKGHTQGARLEIAALRPAPVQVHYLGYPGTLGCDFIDYILADPVVLPPALEPSFTEAVIRLPGCYQVNDRTRPIAAESGPRSAHGLPDHGFVFCCFNSSYKITPVVFHLWMRLLRAVPGSVLWLLAAGPEAEQALRREAGADGIDPQRLIFAPRRAGADHLARHRLADLFLDTVPVNAHTTASDALWAGLPLLTCRGTSFVARVAASILTAAGLSSLIAETLDDYEAQARYLATHPADLARLRQGLAAQRDRCALFDTPRFTGALEQAFTTVWERHCAGLPPQSFSVSDPQPS